MFVLEQRAIRAATAQRWVKGRVTATLQGFATLTRTSLELLVGQQIVVDLEMQLSALEQQVTVSAAPPLVDVASSAVGGNKFSSATSLEVAGRT